ncbi:MAG: hypothetical protein JZU47_07685 [Prolixibacteraceae bacterium]|nr:hypothetical protein [Prolixibacteraceae bacterium]
MAEKENLEFLIQSYGLEPFGVEKFDVNTDRASESGQGWRGKGIDENNDVAISFYEPEGFNSAVSEINVQALGNGYKRTLLN